MWTQNQMDAINSRGGTILVSAAAGSGKTSVLVERVLQTILDEQNPIDANRLLIVTFTNAAAQNMQLKIKRELDKRLISQPQNRLIQRQRKLINSADISTIDSFCQRLIKDNFQSLDIPSDYKIEVGAKLEILRNTALDNVIKRRLHDDYDNFVQLVDNFSSDKGYSQFREIILEAYDFLSCLPFPKKWAENAVKNYKTDENLLLNPFVQAIISKIVFDINFCAQSTQEIFNELQDLDEGSKFLGKLRAVLTFDIEYYNGLINSTKNWDELYNYLKTNKRPTMPSVSKGEEIYKDLQADIKSRRENFGKIIKKTEKLVFQPEPEIIKDLRLMEAYVKELLGFVFEFKEEFSLVKLKNKVADFNDTERWTFELLVDNEGNRTDLSYKIADTYDAVLVDEYQDVNDLQESIFDIISNNSKNLFIVGDVKQCIYTFRQAKPQIFSNRKDSYEFYDAHKDNYPAKILLEKNFRSFDGVTDAVNFVFFALMSKKVGEIDYNNDERLVCFEEYPITEEPAAELHLLECNHEDDDIEAEAEYIALEVLHQLAHTKIYENGIFRAAKCSDIVILMRSTKKKSQKIIEALRRYNLQATCNADTGFLKKKEISLVLNILKIINNPTEDIPLTSVLMSVLFAFTPDDLLTVRFNGKKTNLYTALLQYQGENEQLKNKIAEFFNAIEQWRKLSYSIPTSELISAIYQQTELLSLANIMFNDQNAENNLLLLCEYAKNFESSEKFGPSAFLNFIQKTEENGADLKPAAVDNEQQDSIQIMSIHKSKGLEYPVCIIADTTHQFSTDSNKSAIINEQLGVAFKRKGSGNFKFSTLPHKATQIAVKNGEISEELRNLYVAMTRAKQKVVMIYTYKPSGNSKGNIDEHIKSVAKKITVKNGKISEFTALNAKNIGEWLLMSALVHPSGIQLRQIAGMQSLAVLGSDAKPWDISVTYSSDKANENDNIAKESDASFESGNDLVLPDKIELTAKAKAIAAKMRQQIEMANKDTVAIPEKVTASGLTHSVTDRFNYETMRTPAFLTNSKITPADRGTATHKFLQYCDFEKAKEDFTAEFDRIAATGLIPKNFISVIDIEKVKAFLDSELCAEILSSPKIFKEYNFLVFESLKGIKIENELLQNQDKVLLQGAVDLAYLKNDKLVIVDYKTDRVKTLDVLQKRYESQVKLYIRAMAQATGIAVEKGVIYSLELGDWIDIFDEQN
ncbi:MAG: helicase-exonuclease AddAB subunit AddA [Oscillospiraceae bacterium]|jgi:ATP-dependent helicase/nuclease subunit A|nr:helicase-exonuclease AddAB subunit AddA [Oscillospiraceae bacterium]